MPDMKKYDRILDALYQLLEERNIQNISVSDIARKAGIGKGSIYYYFPSKEAILDALIERNYEKPLKTAKKSCQSDRNFAVYTHGYALSGMPYLFRCIFKPEHHRRYRNKRSGYRVSAPEIYESPDRRTEPSLTEIITQGIALGDIHFEYPAALAEIVLIILAVKLNNTFLASTAEDSEETIRGLVALLEKGTGVPQGTLNYLTLPAENP